MPMCIMNSANQTTLQIFAWDITGPIIKKYDNTM
jgi:hypothetical protein